MLRFTYQHSRQAVSDSVQVRSLLAEYVNGWRDGDVARLARVFATEEGRVLWLAGDPGNETLRSMTFAQAVRCDSRELVPASGQSRGRRGHRLEAYEPHRALIFERCEWRETAL